MRSKGRQQAPRPSGAGGHSYINSAALGKAGIAAGWLLAFACVVSGLAFAGPVLRERVSTARPEGALEVEFLGAPPWMRDEDLAPLAAIVRDQLSGGPFDRTGLEAAAESLKATGWFDAVRQVRRATWDRVEVDAAWVEPCALVRDQLGDHLIDRNGRLLPRSYVAGAGPAFVRLEHPSAARPTVLGVEWPGADIAAGLALLRTIEDHPWRTQIASIDLEGVARGGPLRIRTTRDAVLRWGRAPGDGSAAEVPSAQKLLYLQFLYRTYGRIDAFGESTIDLTSDYVGTRS